MGEMENQAEFYYEKLKTAANQGQTLLEFYREITGLQAGRAEIITINKLIKLFGRFTVYFAIMELSKYDKLEGNTYPLLFTICKNRFERIHSDTFAPSHESLDRQIDNLEKDIEKTRRIKGKLPDSEGLE